MSRGLSRQQRDIIATVERTVAARLAEYDHENSAAGRRFRRYLEKEYGSPEPEPVFDPWVTPSQIWLKPPLGWRRNSDSPSRLRSVERAMASLARRGLLVKGGAKYTTPKAAARWRRRQARDAARAS